MRENFPNLHAHFYALNIYMLGDLLVFDKNCQQADESDAKYRPTFSGATAALSLGDKEIPYSSIYSPNTGSNPSAGYINNPFPRLAIPLALTLFSSIELLGILYTGRTGAGSTTININAFFDKLDPKDRPSNDDINTLIKVYRHGLVHQYFSKNNSYLSYSHLNPDQLFIMQVQLRLNVNYLKKLFMAGFNKIQADEASFSRMESNAILLNQISPV